MGLITLDDDARAALDAPVLVAAFDGWVDAASAASAAATHLAAGGERVASFEGDVLFDYRSRRPVLDIIDGTLVRLTWPRLALDRVRLGGRDILVLHGAEPDFRWKELGEDLREMTRALGVTEWVSLGSIPAAVPHTRPVTVLATATEGATLHEAEVKGPPGLLRVPAACLSALEIAVSSSGIPAVGFYAQVPHYVGGPFAAASLALLEHLGRHLGVDVAMGTFADDAGQQRARLDAAVEADDDVREMLRRLQDDDEEVISGDALAAEIERFLRNQGGGHVPPS